MAENDDVIDRLSEWCARWLGARPAQILFRQRHLSVVTGLRLADGREVVVKARPSGARVHGCHEVQRRLWQAGFPCPQPLAGPASLGDLLATAEAYVPGGAQLEPSPGAPRRFAEALADLIRLAPPVESVPSLAPAPPWVGWDHDQPGIWPIPDDRDADLNVVPGPAWLDEAGARARWRLRQHEGPLMVGHGDWESQNIRWLGRRLHVVHDWDSAISLPEPALVGAAAGVFPASGGPDESASLEETAAFLAAYEATRGCPWTDDERQVCWAAGLWVQSFNARKEALDGPDGPMQHRLLREAQERLRLAGA
jgi:hypothetical protein